MFQRAVWLVCLTCLGCQAILATPTADGEALVHEGQADEKPDRGQQTIAPVQEEDERRQRRRHHKQLLELAEAADDEYEVQLQRGIGLLLLAEERARLGDPSGDVPVEGLLFNAAACLTRAHALRREQARPCWYLHEVWRQLGQPQQARRWLKIAEANGQFTPLTTSEQRSLLLASAANR